jgi:hypothetical protein
MMASTPNSIISIALQQRAFRLGVVALGLCLVSMFFNPVQFYRSYLLAYLFWVSLTLGCLAIVMLQHLVRGAWGALILRLMEAGARTLPLMAGAFLPILIGSGALYVWTRADVVAGDVLLQHKRAYLNIPFFILRTALYFGAWGALALALTQWSRQLEQGVDHVTERTLQRRLRRWSGPGLAVYALTVTFAAIDWVMSLEPHWYSTIYGVLFLIGQLLVALAFAILVLTRCANHAPFAGVVTPSLVHDLGNLMLAFVMLWAYVGFSQFLIIWSGNLAEEVSWYIHRTQGGWEWIALLLIGVHFALPFVLLLSRGAKRRLPLLAGLAALLLGMHWLELFWLVVPAFHPASLHLHWLDIVASVGVGGVWLAVYVQQLRGHALLPVNDPRLQRVTSHE